MTLRHLKIFVTVCETGSATGAGEKLYLAQPSVSLAISELEGYYGIKLFDRISKRLCITEVGKQFLQYATHIVGLFDEMEREVKDLDGIGIIKVGASVTIGNHLLPKIVAEFKENHPKMDVRVVVDNSDKIRKYILSNQIDIGLVEGIEHSEYVVEKKFRDDELVMICAKNHKFADVDNVEIADLAKEMFVLREEGSAGREIFDAKMLLLGFKINIAWESVSTQAIVRAVEAGFGVSILPYLLVKDALEKGRISRFLMNGIRFERNFSVIYHKNKYLTKSLNDFMELCK